MQTDEVLKDELAGTTAICCILRNGVVYCVSIAVILKKQMNMTSLFYVFSKSDFLYVDFLYFRYVDISYFHF